MQCYTKQETKEKITALVNKFTEKTDNLNLNETDVKQRFISEFFQYLGWDMVDKEGQEYVQMEYPVRIEGKAKRVDYAFRNDADNMFFVEAKAPKEDLLKHSFQARSYGWSAGHEITVLTNFKDIIIYNTKTIDPKKQNDPSAVMANINCSDYIKRFDDIYELLSFERVNQGSIREYAVKKGIISATPAKGDYTVDEAFLKLIEDWRDKLARNIILRNQNTTKKVLTNATQKIIDRIIFLRIAEDRGLEDWRNLQNIATNYEALCQYFQASDKKYNSGLFHFSDEPNRGIPDKITQTLKIDNRTIQDIVNSLYDGRYQFGVMPTYILGSVYERFLGKEINLDGRNVKVEDKLEVRKAGGVYYTPEYIAKYIVENTIDKKQINRDFKIVDPACGSGSFLLVAYDFLLRFYEKTYKRKLTIQERKQILLDHIYGVDLDEQAVEVTKLSLHLKLLEGVDEYEINEIGKQEIKALPSLHNNIKCGNSLIDDHIIAGEKAFSWEKEFPMVFGNLGFDVVIGNPPWGAALPNNSKDYLKEKYECSKTIKGKQKGSIDTYALFINKSYSLVKRNGVVGLIVPMGFVSSDSMTALHNLLFENCSNIKVSSYSERPQQIFPDAAQSVAIIKFKKDYKKCNQILSTKMQRKTNENTGEKIINNLEFIEAKDLYIYGRIPKISYEIEKTILTKIFNCNSNIGKLKQDVGIPIYYRMAGGRYFKVVTNYTTNSQTEKIIYFDRKVANSIGAILSSNLLWYYNQVYTCYPGWKQYEIESFPIPINKLADAVIEKLEKIYAYYLDDIEKNANIRKATNLSNVTSFKEYKIRHSKQLIDQIDRIICPLYGLTKEETNFIINYEIEYRIDNSNKLK